MQRVYLSCLVAIKICLSSASALIPSSRIVNGTVATMDEASYLVQLRKSGGQLLCGGALIAPQYVVTAAHCFNEYFYRQVKVVGGVSTLSEKGVECGIESIDLHANYTACDMHTDVAILKLDKAMSGQNITTVRLCEQPIKAGYFIQILGWGKTSAKSEMSNELQTARIPVLSTEDCKQEFGKFVERNMFCGAGTGGIAINKGDSGGPVIYHNQLCGINAFANKNYTMSAFTDAYALRNYIEEALQDLHVLDWD